MASQPTVTSTRAVALIDQLTGLADAFKNDQAGAREGLLSTCSKLISELSHPTESMLMHLWAEPSHHSIVRTGIDCKLFEALAAGPDEGQTSEDIAAKCVPPVEGLLVGTLRFRLQPHTRQIRYQVWRVCR